MGSYTKILWKQNKKAYEEVIENRLKQDYRNDVNEKEEEESEGAGQRKRLEVVNIRQHIKNEKKSKMVGVMV